jgi:hypothetical protein
MFKVQSLHITLIEGDAPEASPVRIPDVVVTPVPPPGEGTAVIEMRARFQ